MDDTALSMAAVSHTFASSHGSDTLSLTESVMDYPEYFGRRYHKYKEGSYSFPNDDEEQMRLNFMFMCIKNAHDNALFFAPVVDPRGVLDVGTGTGIWATQLADSGLAPNAEIVGVDLSPIQPEEVPENVTFEIQDISEPDWDRPLNSFDLIHSRCMMGSLQDFPEFIRTAKRYLKPGEGWLECCELNTMPSCDDGTMKDEWPFLRWSRWINHSLARKGRPLLIAPYLREWMVTAGYVDIHERVVKIPIGGWLSDGRYKRLGEAWRDLANVTLAPASLKTFSEECRMTREQIEVFLADARRSLKDEGIHAYSAVHTVYGRRPTEEEETRRMKPPPRQSST